jgi:hypothetical protein
VAAAVNAAPASPLEIPAGKPRNDLIPRSILCDNPERAGVQVSPDGKYLAWLAPSGAS